MELNDEMAQELLTALDAVGLQRQPSTTTEQRRNSPLLSQNETAFYKNLDGFWQSTWPQGQTQETSQTWETSAMERAGADGGQATELQDPFGNTYSVFTQNNTQVTSHVNQDTQQSMDAQQVSQAFQRDARRYAP